MSITVEKSSLSGLASPQRPSPSPSPSPLHPQTLKKDGCATEKKGRLASDTHTEATARSVAIPHLARENVCPNPGDVGVPKDGDWDHIAAPETRFCFNHKEDEWLLSCTDRWMRPSDFNLPGAELTLGAKLQKYQTESSDPQMHRPLYQAECNGNLWSQVDVPMKRGKSGDEVIYLIRWKWCWTPQSNIDDMTWVRTRAVGLATFSLYSAAIVDL